MDNFKVASQLKLRIVTAFGELSVEQLWDLPLLNLSSIIKSLKKTLKVDVDSELDFLDESKVTNIREELMFNILKDVYLTKKKEQDQNKIASEVKDHNQKILKLIKQKQDNNLSELSIDQLEKLLR